MSNNFKLVLGLIIIVLALTFFWYPGYKKQSAREAQVALENKITELSNLILKDRNCPKVIDEATAFIKKQGDSEDIWNMLGACQFDLGKFDEARISFQKVLSINPEHVGAQNYLKRMEFKAGEIVVTGTETPFDKTQFESRMGLNFDSILTFVKAVEKPSNIPEYLLASYATTKSFNNTVSSLKDVLKKANIDFTLSETNTGAILSSGSAEEIKIIIIEEIKDGGDFFNVKVEMNYQKLTN